MLKWDLFHSGQNYVVVENQNYQLLCTNCVSKCQFRIDIIFCGWIKLAIYWTNAASLISGIRKPF